MPLPAALLARLEKRGIINQARESKTNGTNENKENEDLDEEVIAENYDETERKRTGHSDADESLRKYLGVEDNRVDLEEIKAHIDAKFKGYPGCPNKYNVWHECTLFCKEYWNGDLKKPNKRYLRIRKRMLNVYPLPVHWSEVYDPGTGRFYYWDEESDAVSWLPPNHPRAVVTDSAAHFREERYMVEKNILNKNESTNSESSDSEDDTKSNKKKRRRRSLSDEKNDSHNENNKNVKTSRKQEETKVPPTGRKTVEKKVKIKNDLDPMDPSAYSECPRGGWSDGLNRGVEAKTGADVTASGPLYQMRPYPSPGAILKANAKHKSGDGLN